MTDLGVKCANSKEPGNILTNVRISLFHGQWSGKLVISRLLGEESVGVEILDGHE